MLRSMEPSRPAGIRRASLLALVAVARPGAGPPWRAAAGPPFPEPVDGQAVYDTAELFTPGDARPGGADHRRDRGADEGRDRRLHAGARSRRHHDRGDRGARPGADGPVGRRAGGLDDGLVILFDLDTTVAARAGPALRRPGLRDAYLSNEERQADLRRHDAAAARRAAVRRRAARRRWRRSSTRRSTATPPGAPEEPPARSSTPARRSRSPRSTAPSTTSPASSRPEAIVRAEATIDAIETRTGAEVVVYTQLGRLRRHRPRRPRRGPAR